MNKKRLFYDFLQKHNALQAYKTYFKVYRRGLGKSNKYVPLKASFLWCDTYEGYTYWSELNDKWNIYCKNYTRNHF